MKSEIGELVKQYENALTSLIKANIEYRRACDVRKDRTERVEEFARRLENLKTKHL